MRSSGRSNDAGRPSRNKSRQELGKWGEGLAVDYLLQRGYFILERNARTPYGEIDLVTRQDLSQSGSQPDSAVLLSSVTVFVEVKTRSSEAFGFPEESITPRKRAHLLSAAQAYLQSHPELDGDWRVDVIAIQCSASSREPTILHFENAVT
jgi:putative endonuclease